MRMQERVGLRAFYLLDTQEHNDATMLYMIYFQALKDVKIYKVCLLT